MEQEKILEISHLRKAFGDNEVLKDISLTVSKGEVVSVIGPSGGGKSTLLRCATLLEKMDGGEMLFKGQHICRDENGKSTYVSKEELRAFQLQIGLVFQNFNLFPHYSVLKNVVDPMVCAKGVPVKEAEEIALQTLAEFGLADKADSYPCQLCVGQQQRVSIARALVLDPGILFFDEPTSALDPELTADVLAIIRRLAEKHMTMVVVTHEMRFAAEVSDRIAFMEGGIIRRLGTPAEVFEAGDSRIDDFVGKVGR